MREKKATDLITSSFYAQRTMAGIGLAGSATGTAYTWPSLFITYDAFDDIGLNLPSIKWVLPPLEEYVHSGI